VIATAVTGIDHIDDEACSCAGIQVVSLRGETEFLETIRATAELTLAITLALIRRVPQAMNAVLRGQWNRDAFQGTELFGKTVGIVGLGRLGSIVATYFKVFGMCVVGFDPFVEFPYTLARRCESLDELMAGSDVVSIHVSYSPATRHLINASSLARAKRGAIIVNTSRGGIIDETALLASLKSGRIAGAALDVLNGEPDFAPDHPLKQYACDHDNLVITPHIGGNTRESFEKTELFLADKIRRRWYELETG
jgi:D-3-phosphoglycerate dehydrogenase